MQPRRTAAHIQVTQPIRIRPIPGHRPVAPAAPRRPQGQPVPPGIQHERGVPRRYSYAQNPHPALPTPKPVLPSGLRPRQKADARIRPMLWLAGGMVTLILMSCAALTLGVGLVYADGILPGVYAGGIGLGGLSEQEAATKLGQEWQTITVRDGQRAWKINPAVLGITLNREATAKAAYEAGRTQLGAALPGILGRVEVAPMVSVDLATAEAGLNEMIAQFEQQPVNAGVRLTNGRVEATPPVNGRLLDVNATLRQLQGNAGTTLADGVLELVMQPVQPSITDSTPILEQATRLLSSPLDIRVYDPVTGDSVYWSVMPEEWSHWLTTNADSSHSSGLNLTVNAQPVREYLSQKAASSLDSSRYLNIDEAVRNVQISIEQGKTTPYARVYHRDRQHTVQSGETITSIAWDYGVPYLYIQQANGGISSLSPGQTITIPSPDNFMPFPVVPDKRIVVSISKQRTTVYENGIVKWDWAASTGISDSPTWPGIYQIISHEPNAYAGNWDLWMPNFMGVYQPIPGSEFTNGFHGFPTRGGWQLLWTNSLGTRVTYGCILLSDENAKALYDWAEEGVVVEIQP